VDSLKAAKEKKTKSNVAPKSSLPSEWESFTWKDRVKWLKEHADDVTVRDLESVIEQNSPAVSAVARQVLVKRKAANAAPAN
jgi:hypothetical protein